MSEVEETTELPCIVIVGEDALALRVCAELCATGTHRVVVLWNGDEQLEQRVERLGARYVGRRPEESESLREAGVATAITIMALATDDHCNVQVVLRSRDLNAGIRVVMRQFNRGLGRKIEQNLANCSVLSLSTHAAATYAAAAADATCFYGLQFPDIDGVLVGFCRVLAGEARVGGLLVSEAERRLGGRIVTVGGKLADTSPLPSDAELIVFRRIRPDSTRKPMRWFARLSFPRLPDVRRLARFLLYLDPVVHAVLAIALLIIVVTTAYFSVRFAVDPLTATYFVITTMTTTGYGDITPPRNDALSKAVAMLLMMSGVVFSGMFIAIVASKLTQAQWDSLHGLRKIRRDGHIVVCGAGRVGSRVIDFLLQMGQRIVVIEANPTAQIVDRSRARDFELLTGDATQDATLVLCNLEQAKALIALTQSDTMNLETALGARAHNASLPIVMRVAEGGLATSIKRHFEIDQTFGSAGLAAPAFAGLAFHPGARGRITIAGVEYSISERSGSDVPQAAAAGFCIPLCLWRNDTIVFQRSFSEIEPRDRVLLLYPFHDTNP